MIRLIPRNSLEFLLEIAERDSGHVGLALENSLWTSEAPSQAVGLSSGMGRRNR